MQERISGQYLSCLLYNVEYITAYLITLTMHNNLIKTFIILMSGFIILTTTLKRLSNNGDDGDITLNGHLSDLFSS